MFGLMTVRQHEKLRDEAIADRVAAKRGQITALRSEVDLSVRRLSQAHRENVKLRSELASVTVGEGQCDASRAQDRVDAEKWRAKVAKDKAYEARRVRSSRAKKEA